MKKNPLDLIYIASLMSCDMKREQKILILEKIAGLTSKEYVISLLEEYYDTIEGKKIIEDENCDTRLKRVCPNLQR